MPPLFAPRLNLPAALLLGAAAVDISPAESPPCCLNGNCGRHATRVRIPFAAAPPFEHSSTNSSTRIERAQVGRMRAQVTRARARPYAPNIRSRPNRKYCYSVERDELHQWLSNNCQTRAGLSRRRSARFLSAAPAAYRQSMILRARAPIIGNANHSPSFANRCSPPPPRPFGPSARPSVRPCGRSDIAAADTAAVAIIFCGAYRMARAGARR